MNQGGVVTVHKNPICALPPATTYVNQNVTNDRLCPVYRNDYGIALLVFLYLVVVLRYTKLKLLVTLYKFTYIPKH